jgi:hypothetical protein
VLSDDVLSMGRHNAVVSVQDHRNFERKNMKGLWVKLIKALLNAFIDHAREVGWLYNEKTGQWEKPQDPKEVS